MDCPSEEQLIRMKLASISEIKKLDFDIPDRTLHVFHETDSVRIEQELALLNLDSKLIRSEESAVYSDSTNESNDRKLLWSVLIINAAFFAIELIAGILSDSMGLTADSLDMLADALVYGMSLMAFGTHLSRKKRIAAISGIFQLTLAAIGLLELVQRFLQTEQAPDYHTMISVAAFALIGNGTSLYLLQKSRSKEAHMQASYIFTSNDVLANIGVITAGIVVSLTGSVYPDLIIGTIVFLLVAGGALRILKLAR